jgi:hypothetical protein
MVIVNGRECTMEDMLKRVLVVVGMAACIHLLFLVGLNN